MGDHGIKGWARLLYSGILGEILVMDREWAHEEARSGVGKMRETGSTEFSLRRVETAELGRG